MPGLEPIVGLRVVGDPAAIDGANWSGADPISVVRIAPDEAFAIGADAVDIGDPDAIVEHEHGFSAIGLDEASLVRVLAHVEFHIPPDRPDLVQGKIAGVPARLLFRNDTTLLVVQTAYAADLEARLS